MTKQVTKFDSNNVKTILDECREALEAVAAKHGLKLQRKNCRYQDDELPVAFKMLVVEADADGNAMSSEAKDFVRYAPSFGLKAEDLGREFTSRGNKFRITGLKPRSPKFPILACEVRTGKAFKFPLDIVEAELKSAV